MSNYELNEARAAVQRAKDKAVKARTRLTEAMDRLQEVERQSWPKEPRAGVHRPVVIFTVSRGTGRYTYAAIGISKARYMVHTQTWFVTGRESREFTWSELLEFMGAEGRRNLQIMRPATS